MKQRQQKIIRQVHTHGFVSIDELAKTFSVTPQTIRRDIAALDREGLIKRYHGGAGLATSVENIGYAKRRILCLKEKQAIARAVAARIPHRASVFINIGTTTEAAAEELVKKEGLRVITNNLNVAVILSRNPDIEIYMAGGVVRNRDRGITGHATLDFISRFRADFCIIGISGIGENGELLDFDYREVRVAQAIIRNSSRVILAADHTKFGRNAMVRLGDMTDIDELFTDRLPGPDMIQLLEESEVILTVAGRRRHSS